MKNIISCSGGKDSTALILFCIERKIPIDEVIFCDTGVEYPEIYENIEKMELLLAKEYEKTTANKWKEKGAEYYER